MDMIFIMFLSVIITVYPLLKIDNYMYRNKILGSENKVIRTVQKGLLLVLALFWLITSCFLAVKIVEFFSYMTSSI